MGHVNGFFPIFLEQGWESTAQRQIRPRPVLGNEVLLEHGCAHSFTRCLRLLSGCRSRGAVGGTVQPAKPKPCRIRPFTEKLCRPLAASGRVERGACSWRGDDPLTNMPSLSRVLEENHGFPGSRCPEGTLFTSTDFPHTAEVTNSVWNRLKLASR